MKVKIFAETKPRYLEEKINEQIKKLECDGQEIIDIKFAMREDYIYNFYAMIIYKDKDVAR